MKTLTGLLLSTLLTMGAGCARTDWIDRTLVTVDVTGTWYGAAAGYSFDFDLKQQGSTVKGLLRLRGIPSGSGDPSGPIEGTVGGDVFRFRDTRGILEGEMTANGDEMVGLISTSFGRRPLSLQRVDPSSLPASPPR
jgi:hypothetical protein